MLRFIKIGLLIVSLSAALTVRANNEVVLNANTVTGDFDVFMGMATVTQITGLQDVTFEYPATRGVEVSACIYTNSPSHQYTIKLENEHGGNRDTGVANRFKMLHTNGQDSVDYFVSILPPYTTPDYHVEHQRVYGPYWMSSDSPDCSAPGDQRVRFMVEMADAVTGGLEDSLPEGLYLSTLHIRVDTV